MPQIFVAVTGGTVVVGVDVPAMYGTSMNALSTLKDTVHKVHQLSLLKKLLDNRSEGDELE